MVLPRDSQSFFLVLTFIVMVIVILMADSFSNAVMAITLLSQFLIITTLMTSLHDRHVDASDAEVAATGGPGWFPSMAGSSFTGVKKVPSAEGFATSPRGGVDELWAGTFGVDDVDGDILPNVPASYAHVPVAPGASGADGPTMPAEVSDTNPFFLNRLKGAAEAAPCDYSTESRDVLDGDRKAVEQGRWRNNPHRVIAGISRRKDLMDKYVREELDQEEDSQWWGRYDQ